MAFFSTLTTEDVSITPLVGFFGDRVDDRGPSLAGSSGPSNTIAAGLSGADPSATDTMRPRSASADPSTSPSADPPTSPSAENSSTTASLSGFLSRPALPGLRREDLRNPVGLPLLASSGRTGEEAWHTGGG